MLFLNSQIHFSLYEVNFSPMFKNVSLGSWVIMFHILKAIILNNYNKNAQPFNNLKDDHSFIA